MMMNRTTIPLPIHLFKRTISSNTSYYPPSTSSSSSVPSDRPPRSATSYTPRTDRPSTPRPTRSTDDSIWRSSTRSGPKKTYLDQALQQSSRPSPRATGTMYDTLSPEAQRREDVRREQQIREHGSSKWYAMEREKSRQMAIRSSAAANSRLGGAGYRTEVTPTRGGMNDRGNNERGGAFARPDRPSPFRTVEATSARSIPLDQDRRSTSVTSTQYGPDAISSTAPPRINRDRHTAQQSRHTFDRDRSLRPVKLVAGVYNPSLRSESGLKKGIEPTVRGGLLKSLQARGRGQGKKVVRVMKKVVLPSMIRLENLTNLLGVKLFTLQRAMERIGLENTRAERLLNADDASLVALELNFDPIIDDEAAFDIYPSPPHPDPSTLPLRPPITGIFGHVDHGKTSLLDALRSTTVAAGEAGGITQHIGAFEVSLKKMVKNLEARANPKGAASSTIISGGEEEDSTITFLDTPGHAAFTAMRERGAGVTDVVVLVVAADDGVKPQTEEVIRLIQQSDVGVVVALTKVDKPGVDTLKVKQSLLAAGVEIELFGGDVPCVEVSAVTGQGLPELLETIAAIAEVRELKAEREGRIEGRVIESRVEKGRGNVATVLVLRGSLRPASYLVAGTTWCKVRQLVPPSGQTVLAAYPGQPIEVTGWKELPLAGDQVLEAKTEEEAKDAVRNRIKRKDEMNLWKDVEVINEKRRMDSEVEAVRKEEEAKAKAKGLKGNAVTIAGLQAVEGYEGGKKVEAMKELILIIKADVSGTVEAVVGALEGIGNKEAKVKIIHSSVGDISESDVDMARAVEGCIVGFNVKASRAILQNATRPPYVVPIHTSPIIYRLVDTVRQAVADLLPKTIETRVHGEATVQQIFEITIKGQKEPMKVAGCKIGNGVFQKGRKARVVRDGETIHVGTVGTLKQSKKDVQEVLKGVECGIALEEFSLYAVGDIIQSVEEIEIARTL